MGIVLEMKSLQVNVLEVGRICKDVTMPVNIFGFVYCRKEEGRLLTVGMIPEAQAWMLLVAVSDAIADA